LTYRLKTYCIHDPTSFYSFLSLRGMKKDPQL
jgi:hypothetical protein